MNVFSKATRAAIVWWIVLLLALILTISITGDSAEMISMVYRKVLVFALASVVAGTLVGHEDSNDVPAVIVGWIGAALGCSNQFSDGWFWEASVFGMIGCFLALVIFFWFHENAKGIREKFKGFKRKLKKEDAKLEERFNKIRRDK